jgi:actin-like ATPase involved in cell morphogenesis
VLGRVSEETSRQLAGARPDEVRLTHPAQWGQVRRNVLLEAARQVGMGANIVLVPEPVAAAAHFASFPDRSLAPGQALAVYDLGAGTFDCAVVGATQMGFAVLSEDGLSDLGGLDVDQALAEYVGREVSYRDPSRWQRLLRPESTADRRAQRALREDVKAAKETLSRHPQTEVPMPEPFDDVLVTRTELEALIRPSLLRSVELLAATIRSTGMAPHGLAGIYLVGGSSRIPLVATLIADRLHVVPTSLDQPETAVGLGAHHVSQDGISLRTHGLSSGPLDITVPRPGAFLATAPAQTASPANPGLYGSGPQPVAAPRFAASPPHLVPAQQVPQQSMPSPQLPPPYGYPAVSGPVPGGPALSGPPRGYDARRSSRRPRNKILLVGAAVAVVLLAAVGGIYALSVVGMPSASDCAQPGSTDNTGFTRCLRQLAGTVPDKNTCQRGLVDGTTIAAPAGAAVTCRSGSGDETYAVVYTHANSAASAQAEADRQIARIDGGRVEADWKGNGLAGRYRAAVDQTSGVLVFTVRDRPLVGTLLRLGAQSGTLTPVVMADYFERNVQPGG